MHMAFRTLLLALVLASGCSLRCEGRALRREGGSLASDGTVCVAGTSVTTGGRNRFDLAFTDGSRVLWWAARERGGRGIVIHRGSEGAFHVGRSTRVEGRVGGEDFAFRAENLTPVDTNGPRGQLSISRNRSFVATLGERRWASPEIAMNVSAGGGRGLRDIDVHADFESTALEVRASAERDLTGDDLEGVPLAWAVIRLRDAEGHETFGLAVEGSVTLEGNDDPVWEIRWVEIAMDGADGAVGETLSFSPAEASARGCDAMGAAGR